MALFQVHNPETDLFSNDSAGPSRKTSTTSRTSSVAGTTVELGRENKGASSVALTIDDCTSELKISSHSDTDLLGAQDACRASSPEHRASSDTDGESLSHSGRRKKSWFRSLFGQDSDCESHTRSQSPEEWDRSGSELDSQTPTKRPGKVEPKTSKKKKRKRSKSAVVGVAYEETSQTPSLEIRLSEHCENQVEQSLTDEGCTSKSTVDKTQEQRHHQNSTGDTDAESGKKNVGRVARVMMALSLWKKKPKHKASSRAVGNVKDVAEARRYSSASSYDVEMENERNERADLERTYSLEDHLDVVGRLSGTRGGMFPEIDSDSEESNSDSDSEGDSVALTCQSTQDETHDNAGKTGNPVISLSPCDTDSAGSVEIRELTDNCALADVENKATSNQATTSTPCSENRLEMGKNAHQNIIETDESDYEDDIFEQAKQESQVNVNFASGSSHGQHTSDDAKRPAILSLRGPINQDKSGVTQRGELPVDEVDGRIVEPVGTRVVQR